MKKDLKLNVVFNNELDIGVLDSFFYSKLLENILTLKQEVKT